ncbi:MAG: hypothetical protein QOE23_3471 [Pseudonocardiales bacterium]|nr:hypothetical protein [Pseudonocardiales bacterium]
MFGFRRGSRVVLRTAVRRGRRHKYGPVRLRRGSSGWVAQRHTRLGKPPRYDVDIRRGRNRTVRVRKLPAGTLRRPVSPLAVVLVALALLLVLGLLAH